MEGVCTYKNTGLSHLLGFLGRIGLSISSHFTLIYEKLQKVCFRSFFNLLQYDISINDAFFC